MNPSMPSVQGVFVGRARPLPPGGQPSAIVKQRQPGRVQVRAQGLAGDEQADRRVHGGPDKAVHQYAMEHYDRFRQAFPGQAARFVPGSIGENIASRGMTEDAVCIGDVYRVGECHLQVSQPRSPCWKIDCRYGIEGLSRFVQEQRIGGWYYRVIEPGSVGAGDPIERLERVRGAVSIRGFWDLWLQHRPDPQALAELAGHSGLNAEWRQRLSERAKRLARLGPGQD